MTQTKTPSPRVAPAPAARSWRLPVSLKLLLALLAIMALFALAIGLKNGHLFQDDAAGLFDSEAAWRFLGKQNVQTVARQSCMVAAAAVGMTMVIIMGGIDLSVGSVVALTSVVVAAVLRRESDGQLLVDAFPVLWPLIAAACGLVAGAMCGLANGALITWLRVTPFIVTLGSLLAIRGFAKGISGQQKIDAPMSWLVELTAALPAQRQWLLLAPGVWVTLFAALFVAALLRYTRLGRHIFAVGSNERTAALCGVSIRRVKLIVYALMGALAGLAGILQYSRLTVGDPTVAEGMELEVIAAVVIGGGSLSGGEGSVLGALLGALIVMFIRSGCTQLGLDNYLQAIITGAIIVLAVALDRLRHRKLD